LARENKGNFIVPLTLTLSRKGRGKIVGRLSRRGRGKSGKTLPHGARVIREKLSLRAREEDICRHRRVIR